MFKKVKSTLIISCILYFILGIIMLIFPSVIRNSISYLIGCLFIFCSILGIVMYVKSSVKSPFTTASLVLSVILGAFGVYVIMNSDVFLSFIPLIAGIFMIIDSINKLSVSFDLKKYGYNRWWFMLIISFALLGMGLLIISNLIEAIDITIMVIGGILIFDAISNIFTIYSFSNLEKENISPGLIGDISIKEDNQQ